ncbi:type I restriction-modification system DNA methylase subunit [Herbaspirillum sp. 1173]|uniref:type I restriction-modification system subunit M N-terminal domain-containing protein n=1 Tax=Herbaspirillum sp. 1173 TaxID=2817734 RepID=UPI0028647C1D|nr:type I restriction-modification system subunit M N-terminal domain-containing protein [Herbaspirillum sp. 1173]MDR6742614.1 type I restriction-modification system DNA methylase subunit [Herbaspirillum sp. 1173]
MSARKIVKSIQDIMRKDAGVDGDAQRLSQLCWMFFLKIIDDQDQQLSAAHADYRSPIPKRLQWTAWAKSSDGISGTELLEFINNDLFPTLKEIRPSGKWANRKRVVRAVC